MNAAADANEYSVMYTDLCEEVGRKDKVSKLFSFSLPEFVYFTGSNCVISSATQSQT